MIRVTIYSSKITGKVNYISGGRESFLEIKSIFKIECGFWDFIKYLLIRKGRIREMVEEHYDVHIKDIMIAGEANAIKAFNSIGEDSDTNDVVREKIH